MKSDERKYYFNIKYEESLIRVAPNTIKNVKWAMQIICKAAKLISKSIFSKSIIVNATQHTLQLQKNV